MLTSRSYKEGDFEKYIRDLTTENMKQLMIDNFGGWSDEVCEKKFYSTLKRGFVELFFVKDDFAGFVSVAPERDDDRSFMIHEIHMVKEFQRKGYGSEMIDFVVKKSISLNARRLRLFVFRNNPSLPFYLKNGFVEKNKGDDFHTAIMIREL